MALGSPEYEGTEAEGQEGRRRMGGRIRENWLEEERI